MYLIHTTSLELEFFTACPARKYAILSHTWEDEELDFSTFRQKDGSEKKGYNKIALCCKQAQSEGLDYAWVDTCCIDKSSSSELSEAINSMYRWYAESAVCYVYLSDAIYLYANSGRFLTNCRWLTRGWTLQELLAPKSVVFYDRDWTRIGSKCDIVEELHETTGINKDVLAGKVQVANCSIAQRMSWASKRKTTRIEDVAYSLLGMFSVNMPLLYGEGVRAFQRLQETIIASSDDESIFGWEGVDSGGCGLLAKSPACFAKGSSVVRLMDGWTRAPYSITNRGLEIECHLIPVKMNTYLMPLKVGCGNWKSQVALYLCRTTLDTHFRRVRVDGKDLTIIDGYNCSEVWQGTLYVHQASISPLLPHGRPTFRWNTPECNSIQISPDFVDDTHDSKQLFFGKVPFNSYINYFRPTFSDRYSGLEDTESGTSETTEMLSEREACLCDLNRGLALRLPLEVVATVKFGFNCDFEPVFMLNLPGVGRNDQSTCEEQFLSVPFHSSRVYASAERGIVHYDQSERILRGCRTSGLSARVALHDGFWNRHLRVLFVSIRPAPADENPEGLLWDVRIDCGQIFRRYPESVAARLMAWSWTPFVGLGITWVVIFLLSLATIFFGMAFWNFGLLLTELHSDLYSLNVTLSFVQYQAAAMAKHQETAGKHI